MVSGSGLFGEDMILIRSLIHHNDNWKAQTLPWFLLQSLALKFSFCLRKPEPVLLLAIENLFNPAWALGTKQIWESQRPVLTDTSNS